MIAIPLVTSIIGIGQTYLANDVGLHVMQDLRNSLYQHLQKMPLRFFTTTRTGEIQSRLANDVGGVQSVVTDTASTVLSNVVTIISTIAAMLLLSIPLTVLSLLLMPLFLWLTVRVGKARREVATNTQRTLADLTAITEETLSVSGMLLSKSFGRRGYEIDRYQGENERLTGLLIRQTMIGRSFFALIGFFFSITPALVYLVAGWVNSNHGSAVIQSGMLVGFTTLQSRLFFPIGSMLQVSTEVQSSMALFDRVYEYLDMKHEIVDAPDAEPLVNVRGAVELRSRSVPVRGAGTTRGHPLHRATATAPAATLWTLDDVSIRIEPGQLAALVGPSGAGKTTITYLVPRLYDVQSGAVRIDGHDVRKVTLESLGEAIGIVTQETYLFHDTIRENLLYGKPEATEDAAGGGGAGRQHPRPHRRVPDGYDTVVGERGYRLSGGEKQRLAIARVILKDPTILILDEATSSLDTTGAARAGGAGAADAGRTTIAIAHRLSTILEADVIFVIDRGRVVEQGTHEELLTKSGLYARLYEQQFQDQLIEPDSSLR